MSGRPSIAGVVRFVLSAVMLVGLPLIGLIVAGRDPAPYLEMPPITRMVRHAGFSLPWFIAFTVADLFLFSLLAWAVACGRRRVLPADAGNGGTAKGRLPWWGWAGLVFCLACWLLAWKRFAWFWLFQPHTFLPIWAGFILLINALAVMRSGSCLLLRRPLRFLLLFPVSTLFWWIFEYLNRFVQNWYYTGIEGMGPSTYTYFSSLAFATVLPGVMSMCELLGTVPALASGLARCRPVRLPATRLIPAGAIAVSGAGLALIGIYPDQLFALLWVSPLLIILSLQALTGRRHILQPLRNGDWRRVVIPALAALICGFFWELWNYFSLARWSYSIPYVQRFHLFAMPILGYGGYLPFGLVCYLAAVPVIGDPFDSGVTPAD